MASFQRARTAEQREARRSAILTAAAGMLREMTVAEVTLNELSRRVGLARSNVARYFESREAVLLELLATSSAQWLERRVEQLPARISSEWSVDRRQKAVARDLAIAFDEDHVLCDLLSAQAAVLERNVSTDIAIRYSGDVRTCINGLADLLAALLPELEGPGSRHAATTMIVLVGALWTHTHPAAAMRAALATDPTLATFEGFADELSRSFLVVLRGIAARP